jgi:hypothetical protein
MDNKYLWDRSGDPDPEVQKLEAILGTLRYQPRPLEIPRNIQVGRRSFFPAAAIAAAIALIAVVLGLWFGFYRRQAAPAVDARQTNPQVIPPQHDLRPASDNLPSQDAAVKRPKPAVIEQRRPAPLSLATARKQRRSPRTEIRELGLTSQELAEKQQVLVALRLVSAKLNLAQRKTQGAPQFNSIRNQHKIG